MLGEKRGIFALPIAANGSVWELGVRSWNGIEIGLDGEEIGNFEKYFRFFSFRS